jgi:hypothetical protein
VSTCSHNLSVTELKKACYDGMIQARFNDSVSIHAAITKSHASVNVVS